MRMAKAKRCRVCRSEYRQYNSTVVWCSPDCALELIKRKQHKEYRAETKRRREAIKTHSDYVRLTQEAFNRFIRARDAGNGCMSCGRNTGAKMNAGHYKAVGSHPELRFNEINCHLQCEFCNSYKSGNPIEYRINLIAKIGEPLVLWLEGPHKALKPTIEELKWLRTYYSRRAREALKAQQ